MPGQRKRVDYKAEALIANGVTLARVQTFTHNAEIPRETIRELANDGIVDRITDTPNITCSLTTYDMSNDSTAILGGALRPYGDDTLSAAGVWPQPPFGVGAAWNTPVLNYGSGIGNSTIQVGAASTTLKHFDVSSGAGFDLANEFMFHVKGEGTTAIDAALHFSRCYCNNMTMRFSVDGIAEQTFDFDVGRLIGYGGSTFKYAMVCPAYVSGAAVGCAPAAAVDWSEVSTSGSYPLIRIPYKLPKWAVPIKVIHDANEYNNVSAVTHMPGTSVKFGWYDAASASSGRTAGAYDYPDVSAVNKSTYAITVTGDGTSESGQYIVVSGLSGTTTPTFYGQDYIALVWAASGASKMPFGSLNSGGIYTSLPAGAKKGNVEIYMFRQGKASASTDIVLRAQSCEIRVPLARERSDELGKDTYYTQSMQYPLEIAVSVTFKSTDLRRWAQMLDPGPNYDTQWTNGTNDLELQLNNLLTNTRLIARVYYSQKSVNHTFSKLMQDIDVQQMRFDSVSRDTSVGSDDTETYNFTTDRVTIYGYGGGIRTNAGYKKWTA